MFKWFIRRVNSIIKIIVTFGCQIDGVLPPSAIGLSANDAHGHAPTNDFIELFWILSKLNPAGKTIVDLGCGSGAAICLFRMFPFKYIFGVELSHTLAKTALNNFKNSKRVTILETDARQFNQNVDIVYMFNPFPKQILLDALKNIMITNQRVIVVYRRPDFADALKDVPGTTYTELFSFNGSHCLTVVSKLERHA